jgi:hypothetical protein
MPATKREIRLSNSADRWRFCCPAGHRSWEPTNNHFWCQQCASRAVGPDPEFYELHDRKTDELIDRDQIEVVDDGGLEVEV